MPNRMSPKIRVRDADKLARVNPETLRLWNKYKIDMSLRELSPKTVAAYENDFEHFMLYVYDNLQNRPVTELDEDQITAFLYFCRSEGNNSRRMKRRMSTISAFYKYLRKKRIVTENPMEFIDRPKKDTDIITQTYLTQEQIDLMRAKLKECGNADLELYALFSLSTMARVNAISSVRWEQVDFENRVVDGVLEKENKVVVLYFSEEVRDLLLKVREGRRERGVDDGGWVFYSRQGDGSKSVTNGTLNAWCKKIGHMIGVESLHPHDFRKSNATLLRNKGMALESIADLLNHESTETTLKHYIKKDFAKVRAEKDRLSI